MNLKPLHWLAPLLLSAAGLAQAGDREDIQAVIDAYFRHEESGDMLAQADLMTEDRAMLYVGGRLTGANRPRMVEHHDVLKRHAQEFPGVTHRFEIRDLVLQIYNGDSAIATFDAIPTLVVPAALPADKRAQVGPAKKPLIVALMFVKQVGAWKMAFTAFVPPKP